jgi:hypothetical protein
MEALPFLIRRPPLDSCSDFVLRVARGPSSVSSSFVGLFATFCVLVVEPYFLNVTWFIIIGIVIFLGFSSIWFSRFLYIPFGPFPLPTAWAWILVLDLLNVFHLGFP